MVSSISASVTTARLRVLGLVAWLIFALVIQAPVQERILLLAPLVVVPALLGALPRRDVVPGASTVDVAPWAWIAALALPLALALPRGPLSAALTVPWLLLAVVVGGAGLRHAIAGLPGILRPARAAETATDVAFVGLPIGASWLWIDRMGIVVPGIAPLIGTLTAVHFHFAAFGLVAIGALVASVRCGAAAWAAVLAVAVGTMITAIGFLTLFAFQVIGAVLVGIGGLLLAALMVRGRGGWLVRAAGVALGIGMTLAIAWPTSLVLWPGLLDIDLMVRTHGILNATAVTILAWTTASWARSAR